MPIYKGDVLYTILVVCKESDEREELCAFIQARSVKQQIPVQILTAGSAAEARVRMRANPGIKAAAISGSVPTDFGKQCRPGTVPVLTIVIDLATKGVQPLVALGDANADRLGNAGCKFFATTTAQAAEILLP